MADTTWVVNINAVRANHEGCAEWWSTAGRFVCVTHLVAYRRDTDGRWIVEEGAG